MRGLISERRLRRLLANKYRVDAIAQREQEAYYAALTCCMSDPTLVKPKYENNTIATLTNACGYTETQTDVVGFAARDALGNCAKSPIHGVDTQINSSSRRVRTLPSTALCSVNSATNKNRVICAHPAPHAMQFG